MIKLKKPEFVQRLTIKRIVITLGGVAVLVAGLGVAGMMIFNNDETQKPDQKFSLNKNRQIDVNLNKEISTLVTNQTGESQQDSSVDNMQTIISGQSQPYNSNNLTNSITGGNIGTFQKPLGAVVDTSYLNNQPIDLSKLSDQQLEDYYRQQDGLKIVKVASYNTYVASDGTTPFLPKTNNKIAQDTATVGQSPTVPDSSILGFDNKGNAIYGYTKDGKPIYGFDAAGNPILSPLNKVLGYTADGQPIYGFDKNGNAILSKDGKQNSLNSKQNNSNNLTTDKNGNIIYGYTKDGKPIYGYDKNGNPILSPLNKVLGYTTDGQPIYGYDKNGNSILSKNGVSNASGSQSLNNSSNLTTDKNGNIIYGYTKDSKPIYGYDKNGNPILSPLNKVLGYTADGQPIYGYDKNGNPILSKKGNSIDNIASVGRLGNSPVPALNENIGVAGSNSAPPLVGQNNQKSNVLNNLNKPNNVGLDSSQNSNSQNKPQVVQQQEVDKSSPLVSLNFKDIKPNNGFISYDSTGNIIESKQVVQQQSESSTTNITDDAKPKQSSQKRYLLTNKYTVRAGDYIPAIMQTGVNSDLPGSISARVSENIYDTATGKYLLIPQGTKLLGAYSANIQYGQERVLAAWNEMIYPDGSIVMLNNQPGTDLAGYAGYNDLVNNHYWKLFGNTFILSVLTTGLGYSQNNSSNSQNGSGFNQQLSANTGQMMGQAASTIIQKSINIAPTLTIRNGYRMNILLTQDIVLDSPYQLKYYK